MIHIERAVARSPPFCVPEQPPGVRGMGLPRHVRPRHVRPRHVSRHCVQRHVRHDRPEAVLVCRVRDDLHATVRQLHAVLSCDRLAVPLLPVAVAGAVVA